MTDLFNLTSAKKRLYLLINLPFNKDLVNSIFKLYIYNDQKHKVNAAILIIGNEILSGRTQDTNTSTLATWLNSIGVKVVEVRVVPDEEKIIVETLNFFRKTYDYVFTTGGIGPTHDDITAQSVAKAFGKKYEIHKEAYKILESYYKPGEFNDGRQKDGLDA